jgi:hypothetical protein
VHVEPRALGEQLELPEQRSRFDARRDGVAALSGTAGVAPAATSASA